MTEGQTSIEIAKNGTLYVDAAPAVVKRLVGALAVVALWVIDLLRGAAEHDPAVRR